MVSLRLPLLICTYDLVNNAATKLSRRFGKGGGKKISDIVRTEILKGCIAYKLYNGD